MNWKLIVAACVFELGGLVAIYHLWRKTDKWWPVKVCWMVMLLVPLLGLLFYAFISLNPSKHGDNPPENFSGASVQ
jgi:hypothetical protein